jgi:putative transposase
LQDKPRIHHRRSIRLLTYDYTDAGAYFITICTQNREVFLLDRLIREIISNAWHELPRRFPSVRLDQFIIMPNHIHGIIWIVKEDLPVGAQHRAWPDDITTPSAVSNPERRPPSNHAAPLRPLSNTACSPSNHAEPLRRAVTQALPSAKHAAPLRPVVEHRALPSNHAAPLHPAGDQTSSSPLVVVTPGSLGAIVRALKSRAAKRINRLRRSPNAPVWQRNNYEHVIRNDDDLARIRQYILDNPAKWAEDAENPANWSKANHRRGAA